MNGPIAEFEHLKGSPNTRGELPHGSRGFRFGYAQRRCRPDGQDCVQVEGYLNPGLFNPKLQPQTIQPDFSTMNFSTLDF